MELLAVVVVVALMIAAAVIQGAEGVRYEAINNATGTPGGARFDKEIGVEPSKQVLRNATSFIWKTFREAAASERRSVERVLLIVEPMGGVAYTVDSEVHLSADYVAGYQGDLWAEIEGVLFHETTHVWQWDGNGTAPSGLIEGVADFVRLKAGLAPAHWVKAGGGGAWDQGYDVTARFLDYCDGLGNGTFVADLNRRMRVGYNVDLFAQLLDKTVDRLWSDYKAAYGNK